MGTLQEALVKVRLVKSLPVRPDPLCEAQVKHDYDEAIADVRRSLYGTIKPKFVPKRGRPGKVKVIYMSKDKKAEGSLQYQLIDTMMKYPKGLTLTELTGILKRKSGSVSACLSTMKRIKFVSVTGSHKRYTWVLSEWALGPGLTALDIHNSVLESIRKMRMDISTKPRQVPGTRPIETPSEVRGEDVTKHHYHHVRVEVVGGITVTLKIG